MKAHTYIKNSTSNHANIRCWPDWQQIFLQVPMAHKISGNLTHKP